MYSERTNERRDISSTSFPLLRPSHMYSISLLIFIANYFVIHFSRVQSADARSSTRDASATAELTALANERHATAIAALAAAKAENEEDDRNDSQDRNGNDREGSGSQGKNNGFDAALAGSNSTGNKDIYMRARTPYSSGFLFTVQPEAKVVERKESNEKAFGQTRALLLKKMANTKGGGGGTKVNPRAMDMATTGRNKA